MRNEKILFIGYWNFWSNHRAKHIITSLEKHFRYVDLVGFEWSYSGTGPADASPWYKVRRSISNILHRRIRTSVEGSIRKIVIRDLFAPYTLHLMIDDLWRYFLVCQALTPPYDIAIFDDPKNALLAWLLKRSGRVKRLIYDDHDYHPGKEKDWFNKRLVEERERFCVRQADGVISTNAFLADLRKKQGAKDIVVISNGVDLSLFTSAKQKTPHPPTLIYLGSLSMMWGLDLVIKAMPKLLQTIPDARLLIAGQGSAKATLIGLSQELGVAERVCFLGHLDYHTLPTALAKADVGIVTSQPDNDFRKYATPLKLVEYMAAGLPVIASRVGQTEVMMKQAQAGVLINHSVEDFVTAATHLLNDKVMYEHYSQAAITYAANFDWNLLMEQVYRYILDIEPDNQN